MCATAWHSKTNTCPFRWSDKNIGLGVWLKALKPDTVAEDYTHSWYLHIRTLKPDCSSSQRLFPKQHQEDRNQSQARFTSFYNYYILKWLMNETIKVECIFFRSWQRCTYLPHQDRQMGWDGWDEGRHRAHQKDCCSWREPYPDPRLPGSSAC